MNAACTRAMERLTFALDAGTQLDPEALAHIEACSTCRGSLGEALKFLDARKDAATGPDPGSIEAEVRRQYHRRLIRRSVVVAVAIAVIGLGLLISRGVAREGVMPALIPLGGLCWAILAFGLVRIPARIGLYKRLGPGHQLSGVCLGLARRTGTPVWAWRAGFVLSCFLPGLGHAAGLWPYLVLDLALPMHPDDRQFLMRFRLARWWRGVRARPA